MQNFLLNLLRKMARLIQAGDESMMTEEERNFMNDVLKAQIEAALFYKLVRSSGQTLNRAVKKYVQKFKAEKEAKKASVLK